MLEVILQVPDPPERVAEHEPPPENVIETVPVGVPAPLLTVTLTTYAAPEAEGSGTPLSTVVVVEALAMVTFWVLLAALKLVVAAPSARTTQVPAPDTVKVLPALHAHGPLTWL